MKITKVDIPASDTFEQDGLAHIKMEKLGNLVLIAGANGAGKTRLLTKIKNIFSIRQTKGDKNKVLSSIKEHEESIKKNTNILKDTLNDQEKKGLFQRIEIITKNFEKQKEILKYWSYIETNGETLLGNQIFDFVPKNLNLQSCNTLSKDKLKSKAGEIGTIGISNTLAESCFPYIQHLQNQYFEVTHPEFTGNEKQKLQIIEGYKKLKEDIKIFLNTELTRSHEGDAKIFDFPLAESKLSDGQKILLQFCMALNVQLTSLNESIIFMDEPENHLHSLILIEILDKLTNCMKNGQIWIATHSVPLLAHFDSSYIWYMENGEISYAGRKPEKILKSLLGSENNIGQISDFLSLPSQFATSQFTYECLFSPQTVTTGTDDPQTNQIKKIIEIYLSERKTLRVLDFGAGKGRLISTVYDAEETNREIIRSWLDYIAFDLDLKDRDLCLESISKVYEDYKNRYFNATETLLASFDESTFDFVIMCNVFHEIDPNNWLKLFSEQGVILTLLKTSGYLLIVEDQLIPVGEKAYQKGFLVFDTLQFKKLFKIKEEDTSYKCFDARDDGRLKAHLIPKEYLKRITATTREESIQTLAEIAKSKIEEIRTKEPSYKNGKLYGFWLQQFANSQFALDELSK